MFSIHLNKGSILFLLLDGAPNRVSTNHSRVHQHVSCIYVDEWLPLEQMYYKLRCKLLHNTADESYWFCVLCVYGAGARQVRVLTGSSVSELNGASVALVFAAALGWVYIACLFLSSFPLASYSGGLNLLQAFLCFISYCRTNKPKQTFIPCV